LCNGGGAPCGWKGRCREVCRRTTRSWSASIWMRLSELHPCLRSGSGQPRESGCRMSCRATTACGLALTVGVATTHLWRTGSLSSHPWGERDMWRETTHRKEDGPKVEGETDVSALGMDSDRIRMYTNSDVIIYHILFWFRIQIQILSNTNINGYFEFGFTFEYLLDL
jgi:hypothetical protein